MTFTQKEKSILYEALDLYCIEFCKTLPTNEELSDITFSEEFERKMQKLIDRQKKFYYYWFNTVGKRVAAIILVILLSFATITFSVRALREPVIRFIVETYEKFSSIIIVNDKNEDDIVIDYSFEKITSMYIPEGYILDFEFDEAPIYQVRYVNNDKTKMFVCMQAITDEGIVQANTEGITYENININNDSGVFYSNKGNNTVIFNLDKYVFTLTGTISREELVKIAESIKIN